MEKAIGKILSEFLIFGLCTLFLCFLLDNYQLIIEFDISTFGKFWMHMLKNGTFLDIFEKSENLLFEKREKRL